SWTQVYPGYFDTLGAPVLQGRDFRASDVAPGAPYVTVINETFARRAFAGESAIGKQIECARGQTCEVIGVVRGIPSSTPKQDRKGAMHRTFLQAPTGRGKMVLQARLPRESAMAAAEVLRKVSAIDPKPPAFEIRTLADEVDAALVRERLLALL